MYCVLNTNPAQSRLVNVQVEVLHTLSFYLNTAPLLTSPLTVTSKHLKKQNKTVALFLFMQEGVMRCQRNHSGGQAPPKMER